MSPPSRKPSKKEVVLLLMKNLREELRDVNIRRGSGVRTNVTFQVFQWPGGETCTSQSKPEFVFEHNKGYTNPYNHLKSCLVNGNEEELLKIYQVALADKRMHGVSFSTGASLLALPTQREIAMHDYMRFIVTKSVPISSVEDPETRAFCKHDVVFSRKTFNETMFKVVELVEQMIKSEMKRTKGAIMHDGWSSNAMHYVGIYAVFCRAIDVVRQGRVVTESIVTCPLLSVSPMGKLDAEDADEVTTEFTAKVHVHHIQEIFQIFGLNIEDWAVCQIADNCSTNKRIAELLNVPNVGCNSHKLHLEARKMCRDDIFLSEILGKVRDTMRDCKGKLKNRAILRNLSSLSPVLPNDTRWSGLYHMLRTFNRLRNDIIQASESEGATITIDKSVPLRNKALRYEKMLKEINAVTLELQKANISLSDCRVALDVLLEAVNNHRTFYDFMLDGNYIKSDSAIVKNPHFERGVIKIQRNRGSDMSNLEKDACKHLRIADKSSLKETTKKPR